MVIRQVKSLFRLAELAIILVAVALAYLYRDVVKETYDSASTYVREINQRLGLNGAEPGGDQGVTVVDTGVVPVAEQFAAPAEAEARSAGAVAADVPEQASTPLPSPAAAPSEAASLSPDGHTSAVPVRPGDMRPEGGVQPIASTSPSTPALEVSASDAAPTMSQTAALAPELDSTRSSQAAPAQPDPVEEPAISADDRQGVALDMLLADARVAAKDGRVTEAIDLYRAAIRAYPYSYDAFGELGNIQYSQGRSAEAASSYYQAGMRLLAAGYVREAERLQRLIKPLDAALASSLETKLMLHRLKR